MKDESERLIDWELEMAKLRSNQSRLVEGMGIVRSMYSEYAKQYRAYFDALIAEKFTAEQALDTIKAHGWMPK